jgi:signal transduction histidine kinase/streptogramin lyase
MKNRVRYTFIILILLNLHPVLAQNQELPFKLVEGINGKPLGQINGISQDPNGYMWYAGPNEGGKCIYKFDGARLLRFAHDPANQNSPGGIDPQTICAGGNGIIWIGFGDNGLDSYNPATGIFRHFRHDDKDSGSLSNNTVASLLVDHSGRVWVGTANGLNRLDEKTGKFNHYFHDTTNSRSLSNNVVRVIYEDHQGVIWVGTGFPFFRTAPSEGGLSRLDADGLFTNYKHDSNNIHSLINNKVSAIFEDSRGVFWVGTGGDGLHTMDRRTGIIERHLYDSTKPDQLSRPPRKKDEFEYNNEEVSFIVEDGAGAIWIGSLWNGINRYDTGTKRITHYDSSYGFPSHGSWTARKSIDGVLWIASMDGRLYYMGPLPKPIHKTFVGSAVSGFTGDKDKLWISTMGKGLLEYDQDEKLLNRYIANDSIPQIGHDSTICLFSNGGDSIWVGAKTKVRIFNKSSGKFTDFPLGFKFSREEFGAVFEIYQDHSDDMWFATWAGIFHYQRMNGSIKRYHSNPKDSAAISSDRVTQVIQDKNGIFWFGTWGGGINRLNSQQERFQHYLPGIQVICLLEDFEGTLWAGTVDGLFRYNKIEDRFDPFFDVQSELANERVFTMIEDDSNNLWISSTAGIVQLNKRRDNKFIFAKKYGIDEDLYFAPAFKTKNGEFIFANENGYYSFYPQELSAARDLKILITGLSLDNQPIQMGDGSPLKKPLEEISDLELRYNQNNLSFGFAAVDYRLPERTKYYTQLQGYDNIWREVIGEKSSSYFNVSPGSYVFRIRATNADGVVGEKMLNILIYPPWWKTWWAYAIYGLLLLSAVYIFVRQQKQRVIRNERHRTQARELAQAKEIEVAYTELKSTQAQLIQSEKMASMGELTAGIAHEIQNPLNFVNNFSEINTELIDELKSKISEGKTDEALSTIGDLSDNEQKILYHGKRADAIVKSMLQHSRRSTGQKELTDLNKLIDEYLRLAYHGLRAKDKSFNATIKTDFDNRIDKIMVIPQDIGRALLNLFNNAFFAAADKAKMEGPEFQPTVEVSTKKTGKSIEIKIRDNGNGIPQNVVNKIFQPFFTTKPTGEGTGLGLSLCFDIITKGHGGELKVDTEQGKFAMFTVHLPAVELS